MVAQKLISMPMSVVIAEGGWALSLVMTKVESFSQALGFHANWDAKVSEAMAVCYAMEVANRISLSKVHLEGDAHALKVSTSISNREEGCAHIHLVYENLFACLDVFDDFKTSFVHRGDNTLTHMVARWETSISQENVGSISCLSSDFD